MDDDLSGSVDDATTDEATTDSTLSRRSRINDALAKRHTVGKHKLAPEAVRLGSLGEARVIAALAADVGRTRERQRQRRLLMLAALLFPVGVWLGIRAVLWPGRIVVLPQVTPTETAYLPAIVLISLLAFILVGSMIAAGRSPHVLYRPDEIDITFDDVVGADVVVEEAVKTLNLFLAHKTFAEQMGGNTRRAILFEGPPGTGKTYLAKAMASEGGVPFLFVSSSAFQSMYYGQTNRKIRSYFKTLRKYARREGGAIGFIEELDAIGGARGGFGRGRVHEGVPGVVNELLIQLQSFEQQPPGVRLAGGVVDIVNAWLPAERRFRKPVRPPANILVIGATNRASELDAALLRPGRFDRTIYFDLPSRASRRQIIDYYLNKKAHEAGLDDPTRRDTLSALTAGYSPVQLEHLLDEALVWALRRGADRLSWTDIQRAKMTAEIGLAQPVEYTEEETRTIATHESGHATVAWLVGKGRRLEVLSIVKRKEALGLLAHTSTEERFTQTRTEIEALIQIAFGGMAAEELFFGETSSGVAGDLNAATRMACEMIGSLGMGHTMISEAVTDGDVCHRVLASDEGREAVEAILKRCRAAASDMLKNNSHVVEALRDALLEHQELVGDEIGDVISKAGPDLGHAVGFEPASSGSRYRVIEGQKDSA
jgi:cell division protease FtsH